MKYLATSAVVALLALVPLAQAEPLSVEFPKLMQQKPVPTDNQIRDGRVPLASGNKTYALPSDDIVRPGAAQTLTNKTIDCTNNTCANFPGGSGGGGGGTGNVSGPAFATSGNLPIYTTPDGKSIGDSSIAPADLTLRAGGTLILPTTCSVEGAIYNSSGVPMVCVAVVRLLADDGSSRLLADDGATFLTQ